MFRLSREIALLIRALGELGAPEEMSWSTEERKHKRHERHYWWSSLFIATGVLGGAFASVYFARSAAISTARQADIAEANLVATTRAWLEILDEPSIVSVNWTIHGAAGESPVEDRGTLTAAFTVKNVGGSPALRVRLYPRFVALPEELARDPRADASRAECQAQASEHDDEDPSNVFKDNLYQRSWVSGLSRSAYETVAKSAGTFFSGAPGLAVYLCASYEVIGEPLTHYTAKLYAIRKRDGGGDPKEHEPFLRFGDALDSDHLVLRRLGFGEYAD